MAPIRMSGMNSGLDTESIVKAMVSGYTTKKEKVQKNQTKLEWSQEIWKGVNSKVYSMYTGLDKFRFSSNYKTKKTSVSDPTKATVTAGSEAANGTQKLRITKMATSGYLTGAKIQTQTKLDVTGTTKLSAMGVKDGSEITVGVGDDTKDISLKSDMSVNEFIAELKGAGVNASFDEKSGRFFISSKSSGAANDFTLKYKGEDGLKALQALGIYGKSEQDIADLKATKDLGKYGEDGKLDEDATKASVSEAFAALKQKYSDANSALVTLNDDKKTAEKNEKENRARADTGEKMVNYLKDKKLVARKRQEEAGGTNVSYDAEYYAALDRIGNIEGDINKGTETDKDFSDFVKGVISAYDPNDLDTTIAGLNEQLTTKTEEYNAAKTAADGFASQLEDINDQILDQEEIISGVNSEISKNELYQGFDINTADAADVASAAVDKIKDAIRELKIPDTATRIKGEDAEIYLNGAMFTSDTNNFSVNGLNITVMGVTGDDEISLNTSTDTDAIYDKVKDLLSSYNDVVNELQKLYNAESAKDYQPLTEDEKAEMSETEIEKWETKIKDSLLRRDTTLGGVINTMTMAMAKSYNVTMKDGTTTTMALANVGVHTLGFLNSGANEQYAYHIDGDEDDTSTSGYADKLRAMIEEDPDAVADLVSQVSQGLYKALGTKVGATSTELSSAYTIYNDKQMKKDLDRYKKDVKQWEERIADTEDMYYKKFTAMEKALANINSSQSSLTGLMGG